MTIPRNVVQIVADAYTVFVLVLSTDAFLPVLVRGSDPHDLANGAPVMQACWGSIYAITFVSLASRRKQGVNVIRANKPLVLLVLLTYISILWSADRSITFHGATILLFSALFAVDLSIRYTLTRQIQLICVALALVIGISVLLELLFPGFVPRAEWEGVAWHGVFANKNQLGRMAALGAAACLALPIRSRWIKALAVACGGLTGVLAQSASAVGYLAIIVGLFMWSYILQWRPKQRRIAMAASAIVVIVMISMASQNLVKFTAMIGKNASLSGRTGLWTMSLAAIQEQPLLGYGYGAFWGKKSQQARPIREELNWDAPHSHNGYIDLALGLGFVGLAAYSLVIGTIVRRGYLLFINGQGSYRKWPLIYVAFISLYQLTESSIITGDYILWILLCWLACSLTQINEGWMVSDLANRQLSLL